MKKDLMAFSPSSPSAIPTGRKIPIAKPHFPSHSTQTRRFGPVFQSLQDVMNRRSVILQQSIQGVDPEFVLVFEVAGSVSNFAVAVKNAGMEWLLDGDTQFDSDDEFFLTKEDGTPKDSKISAKLYLTMTNQRAMQQMLSLWNIYADGKTQYPSGMTAFRDVFAQLKDIRKWDVRDRFEDTGVIDIWNELLLSAPSTIKFEIELWYRDSEQKRNTAQNAILSILNKYDGTLVRSSIYEEIGFHGLIVECPAQEIQRMLDHHDHELINADQIMTIRATGQTLSIMNIDETTDSDFTGEIPLPTNPPVIALLDGVPLANHTLLRGRIDINDPEDFESIYQAKQRLHGTTMASLIIHGDLNNRIPPLDSMLYVRPIMKPNVQGKESVPEDRFFVDILHEALHEIGESSSLSTIRIVNLSIGNFNKPFIYALSPEAKMLDWLSEKYNLLIIVSSGNCPQDIYLPITYGEYKLLSDEEKLKCLYDYIWQNQVLTRILSPSECINGVCVGATHSDFSNPLHYAHLHNPIPNGYPAAYSCFGGGYQGSIKPDMVMNGGKQLFSLLDVDSMPAKLRANFQSSKTSPGQLTASGADGLNSYNATRGTSNATALVSRLCSEYLNDLHNSHNINIPAEYEAVALKTMLLHSCSWGDLGQNLVTKFVPQLPRLKKKETLKWIGHGFPNPEISSFCTDQRATLMGYGELSEGTQSEFRFPLPTCLISQAVLKRLTITLTWLSPIAPRNKNYRLAKLGFSADNVLIARDNSEGDDKVSRRGTVQHEVFVGNQASTYVDGTDLKIVVSCKKEPNLSHPVKYVLMATLEVAPETHLPIYQEIEARVQTQVNVEV